MISYLAGTVQAIAADSLTLVTCGVGRRVHITTALASRLRHGQEIELHTVLVVREDSMTLFGFDTADERDVYETLQTVSGVGPKLALAVLSVLSPDEIRAAVTHGDEAALTKVPGIGKKGAARMLLELSGKLVAGPGSAAPTAGAGAGGAAPASANSAQVLDALTNLGWKAAPAQEAIDAALADDPDATVPALLRAALRSLGGRL